MPSEGKGMNSFRWPRYWRALAATGTFVCLSVLAVAGLLLILASPQGPAKAYAILSLAVALLLGSIFLWLWYAVSGQVTIDPEGIHYVPGRGGRKSVAWDTVARIRVRDSLEVIELFGETTGQRVALSYNLLGFSDLMEAVIANLKGAGHWSPTPQRFRGSRLSILVLWVVAILGSLSGMSMWLRYGEPVGMLLGLSLLVPILADMTSIRAIVCTGGFIVVRFGRRQERIPFGRVSNIYLRPIRGPIGGALTVVVIEIVDGSEVMLHGVKEGSVELYGSLDSAWNHWRARQGQGFS